MPETTRAEAEAALWDLARTAVTLYDRHGDPDDALTADQVLGLQAATALFAGGGGPPATAHLLHTGAVAPVDIRPEEGDGEDEDLYDDDTTVVVKLLVDVVEQVTYHQYIDVDVPARLAATGDIDAITDWLGTDEDRYVDQIDLHDSEVQERDLISVAFA